VTTLNLDRCWGGAGGKNSRGRLIFGGRRGGKKEGKSGNGGDLLCFAIGEDTCRPLMTFPFLAATRGRKKEKRGERKRDFSSLAACQGK